MIVSDTATQTKTFNTILNVNRETLSKKCKILRENVTMLTSKNDKITENAKRTKLIMLLNQMKSLSETLSQVNAQIELLIKPENMEMKFERVLHYEIAATTTRLEERTQELERATQQE